MHSRQPLPLVHLVPIHLTYGDIKEGVEKTSNYVCKS